MTMKLLTTILVASLVTVDAEQLRFLRMGMKGMSMPSKGKMKKKMMMTMSSKGMGPAPMPMPSKAKGNYGPAPSKGKGKGKGVSLPEGEFFNRIASFPVCSLIDSNCNTDEETAAEIVTVSDDGSIVVFSNSPQGTIGFVDISDPFHPVAMGTIDVGGEPTSIAACNGKLLVGVNTSPSFIEPSGIFHVVDIYTMEVLRTGDLGGQPDSVAVSPDCTTAAIAIENERDEDLGDGGLPQMPAGFVVIMDISASDVSEWTTTQVDVTGLGNGIVEDSDPEPEFVAINEDGIAVVTLQENNGIVLIDTKTALVVGAYSAGSVDLKNVDAVEDGIISQTDSLDAVPREPDGVTWIGNEYFATANEGDWNGGSRGFTIWSKDGHVIYDSGNNIDILTAQIGHYPDERSENKGNEPENLTYGKFGKEELLFLNSERSSLVLVFDVKDVTNPALKQVLPAGAGPEGAVAVPNRNLLIVASEGDDRGDKLRSVINIYYKGFGEPVYPFIYSDYREDGTPIPFSALSALATIKCDSPPTLAPVPVPASKGKGMAPSKGKGMGMRRSRNLMSMGKGKGKVEGTPACNPYIFYTVEDSFYNSNRVLAIDTSYTPAVVVSEMRVMDSDGIFEEALVGAGFGTDAIASLINDDSTVNIDPEGIETSYDGGFWLVHEGAGTTGDDTRPFETPNILFYLDESAVIKEVILPPAEVIEAQVRFGYEGVAEAYEYGAVVVVFQRELQGDPDGLVRLGAWDTETQAWGYAYYPLDEPMSQNGGWVGLSDIAYYGDAKFLILERDNQGGPDASIKKIYMVDLNEHDSEFGTLTKSLVFDLLDTLASATNGPVVEKVEGITIDADGNVWINNDNDGVDDNSGEQLLLNLGKP